MKTTFRNSFLRDVERIRDKQLLSRLRQVIVQLENAKSPSSIPKLKQLKGEKNHFRIRIGEYRLGLKLQTDAVTVVRFLHRKEIYRYFP